MERYPQLIPLTAFIAVVLSTGTIQFGSMNLQCPESPELTRHINIDTPDFNLEAGNNLTKDVRLTYVNLVPSDLDYRIFVSNHSNWFHIGKQSPPSTYASCYSTTTTNIPVTITIPQGVQDGKYTVTLSIPWPGSGAVSESPIVIMVGSEPDSSVVYYVAAAVGTIALAAVATVFVLEKKERQKKPFER